MKALAGTNLLVDIALLTSCRAPQAVQPQPLPPRIIKIASVGGGCGVSLGSRTYDLERDKRELREAMQRDARVHPLATIEPGDEVAFRCFGSTLYLAQSAGYKVGFIGQPAD